MPRGFELERISVHSLELDYARRSLAGWAVAARPAPVLGPNGGRLGSLALLELLERDGLLAATPAHPKIDLARPYAARPAHFEPRAKQLLIIFCVGAVSQIDTFDYKPELFKFDGQDAPALRR